MLFDERDMRVFQNPDAINYFKEILQSYYSQNYRATVVLLYSFVIYDLFMKLQTMANEGEKKAKEALEKINKLIENDERYSKVEVEIIEFFNENCGYYFKNFASDINYLKECRNKCAHLKVDDNSLYVPKDYQAKMLICSMYDNILSVKAPFISDLFSFAKADVEAYSNELENYVDRGRKKGIKDNIKSKYLSKMTYDSLKKSYKTFIKLCFVTEEQGCKNNFRGLSIFVVAMTEYIVEKGNIQLFKEDCIENIFQKITVEQIKNNRHKKELLQQLMTAFAIVMNVIRENEALFTYLAEDLLSDPCNVKYYEALYPDLGKTKYQYFKETKSLHQAEYIHSLFEIFKNEKDFDMGDFVIIMVKSIPAYNGFNKADTLMDFFKSHFEMLSDETINEFLTIYSENNQCINRSRHEQDMKEVKELQKKRNM